MTMYQFAVIGVFVGFFVAIVNGVLQPKTAGTVKKSNTLAELLVALYFGLIGLGLGWMWNL